MKKADNLYWVALCVGYNDEDKKIIGSVMTFWARNKFYALKAVEGMLPDHDDWVKSDGTTHPHQLMALEQCTPDDAGRMCLLYSQTFQEMMNVSGPVPRGVA